jgi:transcriptional regulator with XRE-family HTH domain
MREIAQRIKAARKRLAKTQAWLAGEMGVTRNAVSNWECGKNLPKGARLAQLFRVLQLPGAEALGSSDDRTSGKVVQMPLPAAGSHAAAAPPPGAVDVGETELFIVSSVDPMLLLRPRRLVLLVRDVAGQSFALSVDREVLESFQTALETLREYA